MDMYESRIKIHTCRRGDMWTIFAIIVQVKNIDSGVIGWHILHWVVVMNSRVFQFGLAQFCI